MVHADETSWRNDGLGHFVWFAGNENLAFFHLDRHRSAEVAQALSEKILTALWCATAMPPITVSDRIPA